MEQTEKVNIFSEPEKINAIIKSRLAQFSTKGGSQKNSLVKWTESELELRNAVIIDYLTINGLSRERTAQQIGLYRNHQIQGRHFRCRLRCGKHVLHEQGRNGDTRQWADARWRD